MVAKSACADCIQPVPAGFVVVATAFSRQLPEPAVETAPVVAKSACADCIQPVPAGFMDVATAFSRQAG